MSLGISIYAAWLQVSQGKAKVSAMFKTPSGSEPAGSVVAESGCWSMLKGGLTAHASGPVELYFEVIPFLLLFQSNFSLVMRLKKKNTYKKKFWYKMKWLSMNLQYETKHP